jgi:DNA repair protein RecN (Recombination protein N)
MLRELHIQNLAVVADATLSFGAGLNVLSGSTGAGKSLILGAVNFLLGERAGAQVIRAGADAAAVEGVFDLPGDPRAGAGTDLWGGVLRLRREIQRNGRSAAFLNGKPCPLKQIQDIARDLIEPHGQNEQLRLKFPENHVAYLDKFARNEALAERYRAAAENFRIADREVREFDARIAAVKEKKELLEHRLGEIARAKIASGEKQKLEESIRVLEHLNEVFEALAEVQNAVYEDESSAVALLSRARSRLARIAALDARFEAFAGVIENAEIALKDVVADVRSYLDGLQFEPGDLGEKQARFGVLLDFERRYAKPIDEILAESERWKSDLAAIGSEDGERPKLAAERASRLEDVRAAAVALSETRRKAARELDKKMTHELGGLMMAGARFRTDIGVEEDAASDLVIDGVGARMHPHGIDRVEFCVQTNPGEPEGALADVASSGELSRVALALKEVVSTGREGSLLVLDEVDVGVGADLGDMIAGRLERLAKSYQIVCITHMPQIAAKAQRHLVAGKSTAKGRTFTQVSVVSGEARVAEIARMLGGREGSEKRLALARELLRQ